MPGVAQMRGDLALRASLCANAGAIETPIALASCLDRDRLGYACNKVRKGHYSSRCHGRFNDHVCGLVLRGDSQCHWTPTSWARRHRRRNLQAPTPLWRKPNCLVLEGQHGLLPVMGVSVSPNMPAIAQTELCGGHGASLGQVGRPWLLRQVDMY